MSGSSCRWGLTAAEIQGDLDPVRPLLTLLGLLLLALAAPRASAEGPDPAVPGWSAPSERDAGSDPDQTPREPREEEEQQDEEEEREKEDGPGIAPVSPVLQPLSSLGWGLPATRAGPPEGSGPRSQETRGPPADSGLASCLPVTPKA